MPKNTLRQSLKLFCGLLALLPASVNAAPHKPNNKTETLKAYQERLKSEEREKAELEKKAESLNDELSRIKEELVNATTQMLSLIHISEPTRPY